MTSLRRLVAAGGVAMLTACASAPPAAPTAPTPTYEQKLSWIVRLEDQRVLRDPVAPAPPPLPSPPARGRHVEAPEPPPVPDLTVLVTDQDSRIRRRAALGIGRVRLPAGVPPLVTLLGSDAEPEVRQMAAFGLGLIGSTDAVAPLERALGDQAVLVRGRAAQALGLVGSTSSGPAIAGMVSALIKAGALASVGPDDSPESASPEARATAQGLYALTALKAYEPLASVVLDAGGHPVSRWWPVAFALGRATDKRAIPALRALAQGEGSYTRGFAARGLGRLHDGDALPLLSPLVAAVAQAPGLAVEAVRAIGDIAPAGAFPVLFDLLKVPGVNPGIRAEAVTAIGKLHEPQSVDTLLDLLSDRAPSVRAAAIGALAETDRQTFLFTLSGLGPDAHWQVRAATAAALGAFPAETAGPLLEGMLKDEDQRVVPAVIEALVQCKSPHAATVAFERLKADDPVVRAAAAEALGELKPEGAAQALTDAAEFARRDGLINARTSALSALSKLGRTAAEGPLTAALADKDWAVRVRAADLLHELDPSRHDEMAIRPAPTRLDAAAYSSPDVVAPKVSTQLYIDTDKGTIQVELLVLDAPLTVKTIIDLARQGYFGGVVIHRVVPDFVVQDGDPRGDGEGGPGFTIRDELNEHTYQRGTVGMALAWRDTGGSQFFIALSPQPHLDAHYTVIGQVVSGMDVADKLAQGDLIRGIRVWDGTPASTH